MTTESTASTDTEAPRPMPLWASIPIILVCLSAGGWILSWYIGTHSRADEPHLLGDVPVRTAAIPRGKGNGPGNGNGPGRNWTGWLGGGARGIAPLQGNRDGYDAHTEHARATYTIGGNGKPNLSVIYGADSAYGFVPDDVRKTIYAARRLVGDKKYTDAIKLTPAQVEQVRQRARTFMQISAADRTTLLSDFDAYRKAKPTDRTAAQTKALADLDAVADRSKEPTRAAFADGASKINAIVTADQWKQLQAMGLQP